MLFRSDDAALFQIEHSILRLLPCRKMSQQVTDRTDNDICKDLVFTVDDSCNDRDDHKGSDDGQYFSKNVFYYRLIHFIYHYARISTMSEKPVCVVTIITVSPTSIVSSPFGKMICPLRLINETIR